MRTKRRTIKLSIVKQTIKMKVRDVYRQQLQSRENSIVRAEKSNRGIQADEMTKHSWRALCCVTLVITGIVRCAKYNLEFRESRHTA
jgi:hypothetical protein